MDFLDWVLALSFGRVGGPGPSLAGAKGAVTPRSEHGQSGSQAGPSAAMAAGAGRPQAASGGDPDGESLPPSTIEFTHRFLMECLRMYPIVPISLRDAMNSFAMAGYEIPAGSRVAIARDGNCRRILKIGLRQAALPPRTIRASA